MFKTIVKGRNKIAQWLRQETTTKADHHTPEIPVEPITRINPSEVIPFHVRNNEPTLREFSIF
jgi:hypothetical protein